jgi:hypothetical protein
VQEVGVKKAELIFLVVSVEDSLVEITHLEPNNAHDAMAKVNKAVALGYTI